MIKARPYYLPRTKKITKDTQKIKNADQKSDPLLDCLVFLCDHFGKTKSAEAIKSGLAYDDKGMSPVTFCEAAEIQGFKSEIYKKSSLIKLSNAILPCVLFLRNDAICVLLEIKHKSKSALVFLPDTGSTKTVKLSKLSEDYNGYAILIHPETSLVNENNEDDHYQNHWFWGLMNENRSIYLMVILASIFINLFALISPLFIMNVYDRVIPNNAIETGWALGIGALAAFIFDFIFRTIRGYLIDFAGRKTDVLAARRIYDHVIDMKLADRPSSSGAFATMLRNFDSVREFFTSVTITALVDLPFTILFLFFVYQLGGSIVFILIGLLVFAIVSGFFIQYALKRVIKKSVNAAQNRHGLLVETIHGLEAIKVNYADGKFRSRYGEFMGDDARFAQKSRFLSTLGINISTFLQQIASVLVVLTGMYLVQDGDMTAGGLIACVILGGRAIAPIGQVANLIVKYHQAGDALKTLNRIMSSEIERPRDKDFLHRPDLKGEIAFEKVSFAYPGVDAPVLNDVSFNIQPGERVGIIGRVGSGKSTIARLMMKLYEPDKGVILMDNTDHRQIDPADLRQNIAYLSQDVVLFHGSVKDNIIVSVPRADEKDILDAATAAGVHDFVSRHPLGYDAPVGEHGSALSGGQRQAIAFARSIIRTPNVFICDEPTSAMDSQTEDKFIQYMNDHIKGKTFVLITHKHSMLSMVDRLILIHEGKVIMDDTRDEVVKALNSGKIKVKHDG